MKGKVIPVLLVLFLSACWGDGGAEGPAEKCPSLLFVDSLWLSGDQCLRGGMVEDLIAQGSLIGLTQAEVYTKLGPPSEEVQGEFITYLVNWRQRDQYMLIHLELDSTTQQVAQAWLTD